MISKYSILEKDLRGCALKIEESPYTMEMVEKDEKLAGDPTKLFSDFDPDSHKLVDKVYSYPTFDRDRMIMREMTDKELVLSGNRKLKPGEKIEDGKLIYVESPGEFYNWCNGEWQYDTERKKESLNSEIIEVEKRLETAQAKKASRELLGMFVEGLSQEINKLLAKHSELCHELSML